MKKQPPFPIGSKLKHVPTDTIIILERYDTQLVHGLSLSIGGGTTKRVSNYNFLYGFDIKTHNRFSALTEEFELLK